MTVAVYCGDCDERVWPPVDAEGPGGQTAIAARDLALDHVRESEHTDVHVTPGCYYVGDGERPTAFGDGVTDPADVVRPTRGRLASAVENAARTLRDAGESAEDWDEPSFAARHMKQYADAIESHVTHDVEGEDWPWFPCPECGESMWLSGFDDATTVPGASDHGATEDYREVAHCGVCEFIVIRRIPQARSVTESG